MDLRHVGVYREVRSKRQRPRYAFLLLHVSGLVRMTLPGHDLVEPPPFLVLILPGELMTFAFRAPRENWVLQFTSGDLRPVASPGEVALRHGDGWVAAPRLVEVSPAQISGWREEFARLRELLAAPTPANRLAAELAVSGALRHFLDRPQPAAARTPAARFKALLDDRANLGRTLAELGRGCGVSPDHLRVLFRRAYGIAPAAYRERQRLAAVDDLMAATDLSLKQIAARSGFRHPSHLSAAYRKARGVTPREALRQLRQG
jgi:AraC-like DNA-binding protein